MTRKILEVLAKVPRGRVTSYGVVAALAGMPNGARQVVRVLHASSEAQSLAWHRIVRKDGSIALPRSEGFELQKTLLESEQVEVSAAGRVDLTRFGWPDGLTQREAPNERHNDGNQARKGSRQSRGAPKPSR